MFLAEPVLTLTFETSNSQSVIARQTVVVIYNFFDYVFGLFDLLFSIEFFWLLLWRGLVFRLRNGLVESFCFKTGRA